MTLSGSNIKTCQDDIRTGLDFCRLVRAKLSASEPTAISADLRQRVRDTQQDAHKQVSMPGGDTFGLMVSVYFYHSSRKHRPDTRPRGLTGSLRMFRLVDELLQLTVRRGRSMRYVRDCQLFCPNADKQLEQEMQLEKDKYQRELRVSLCLISA